MDVGDVMTRAVLTCSQGDSLERAAQLMWDGDCGSIPVVDSRGRAVGMVTDRDICMAAYMKGRRLADIRVHEVASRHVFSTRETGTTDAVQALMARHKVRRIVIVDGEGCPVGIVSVNDLVRHTRGVSRHLSSLSQDGVVRTLAEICQPTVPHFAAAAAE